MRSASFGYTQDKRGFTLIELMVAISIVAILATIGLTLFSNAQKTARDGKRRGDLDSIAKALELYKLQHQAYPIASITCSGWSGGWPADTASTHLNTLVTENFIQSLPVDPLNKHPDVDVFSVTGGSDDFEYCYSSADGSIFTLSTELETINYADYGNYSVKSQQ